MNTMTIYISDVRQNPKNNLFPHRREIKSVLDLNAAAKYDNTCVKFVDDRRKNENFIEADCAMFDVDNTHTENSNGWITPAKVKEHFPDVCFYVVYSRNHMKEKNGKPSRPKFHVYFPIKKTSSVIAYEQLKTLVCDYFRFFDKNAKDVARQFFGVENPRAEYYEGNNLLSEFMKNVAVHFRELENEVSGKNASTKSKSNTNDNSIILEGARHSTLLSYATAVLKRYGGTKGTPAFHKYMKRTHDCFPALDSDEIWEIWKSALKFYNERIKTAPDYIEPQSYNRNLKSTVKRNPKAPSSSATDTGEYVLPITNLKAFSDLQRKLYTTKDASIEAVRLMLKAFGINLAYNEMTHMTEVHGLPEFYRGEENLDTTASLFQDILKALAITRFKNLRSNFEVIALENRYHPVLKMLTQKAWDGNDRMNEIYNILGITEALSKVLVHKWALQTIALLYNDSENPISAQGVLVLQGKQGIGKTEFFKHLALDSNFFKEGAVLDMSIKDTIISATSVWICELGEIDSTLSKKQSALKAFITSNTDRYREPYARKDVVRVRRTALCGTVNPKSFLQDETGNRRYWTVPVNKIDLDKLFHYSSEWYAQFWRQMIQEYADNPLGYLLTKEEQERMNEENINYEVEVHGEDEFLSVFNISAPQEHWGYKTAAEITSIINDKYPKLNLTSANLGKYLFPKLERTYNVSFDRKIVNGRRLRPCPPQYWEERNCQAPFETPICKQLFESDTDDTPVDF